MFDAKESHQFLFTTTGYRDAAQESASESLSPECMIGRFSFQQITNTILAQKRMKQEMADDLRRVGGPTNAQGDWLLNCARAQYGISSIDYRLIRNTITQWGENERHTKRNKQETQLNRVGQIRNTSK
jgi:hypothetical protein